MVQELREMGELGNLINHLSMNWSQFTDPVSHICPAGAAVASLSLITGSNPFTVTYKYFTH